MKRLHVRTPVVIGAAIVLILDAVILAAAAWNRSGVPEAQLALTEREASLPAYVERDNTGLFLTITLNRGSKRNEPSWFDRAKMKELGFDVRVDPADKKAAEFYGFAAPRTVFVVLEYDGEAWRSELAEIDRRLAELQANAARGTTGQDQSAEDEKKLRASRVAASHLFVIDAGLDQGALRRRYPDRGRFAVAEAVVSPRFLTPENGAPHFGAPFVTILTSEVHVPGLLRPRLAPYVPGNLPREERLAQDDPGAVDQGARGRKSPPRYRAVVAYGRRLEPWLVDVQPLEAAPEQPETP